MIRQALVAGGGIGGLAAALAASRAGWDVRLYERATAFSEVGAGVQLGPNVVRVLHGWGLQDALARVAALPHRLQVRNAVTGLELGVLPLGKTALRKYGAPYVTIHRADLHALLLHAVQARDNVWLNLQSCVAGYADNGREVTLQTTEGRPVCQPPEAAALLAHVRPPQSASTPAPGRALEVEGDALIGADGLWSRVRQQMLGDAPPRVTGHLAYRAMVAQASLPERLRSGQVTAWLGPRLHVVQYPVRGGEWLNVVAIVQGSLQGDLQSWDHSANAAELQAATRHTSAPLRELIDAVTQGGSQSAPAWRLWPLCDRPPISGAHQQAQGRVALLGDAAHPMRPYLAQGAGMAIEDAAELGAALAQALDPVIDVPTVLQRYALNRWQRNARVQARSQRNGQIFHAQGPLRWARDASMKLLGERLLDLPWLYGARASVL
ncbi:MAG: FAD-dependent monooxygenase [Polaromonas sp.]